MTQATQVTVERLISAHRLSFLQTPFSGVAGTPGGCSPPLALSSLDVGLDPSAKLVEKEDRTQESK